MTVFCECTVHERSTTSVATNALGAQEAKVQSNFHAKFPDIPQPRVGTTTCTLSALNIRTHVVMLANCHIVCYIRIIHWYKLNGKSLFHPYIECLHSDKYLRS